ncbi:hypothetical protein RIF29_06319 [Crotalaria pallida]|uniref:Secreted protein n=1 Tax=Crotalaria pallida TaxID=3830 RepID=A0AAN9J330_CROPI
MTPFIFKLALVLAAMVPLECSGVPLLAAETSVRRGRDRCSWWFLDPSLSRVGDDDGALLHREQHRQATWRAAVTPWTTLTARDFIEPDPWFSCLHYHF